MSIVTAPEWYLQAAELMLINVTVACGAAGLSCRLPRQLWIWRSIKPRLKQQRQHSRTMHR
jgi:hypothetical protein